MDYNVATKKIDGIISEFKNSQVLQEIIDFLYENFEKYSWLGIYIVRGDDLTLGPWQGEHATEHTKIPIGQGICGYVANSGKTEVVSDVSKDDRYLACFISTRSEIVVPIKKNDVVISEIDIDSDLPNAFNTDFR